MKRALCVAAVPGLGLVLGCNLILGTEPPVLRDGGSGGVGGAATAAIVGVGVGVGGTGSVSSAEASSSSGSGVGEGGSPAGVCGDGAWAHWSPGGAHQYQVSTGSTEQYVTDSLTGLDWQRQPSTSAVSWSEADTHCKLLKWADRTGWRLPTRMELLSIVDYTKAKPSIDGVLFLETLSDQYWTSSPSMYVPDPPGSAYWRVSFAEGGSFPGMADSDVGQIRCVRGGAPPLTGSTKECYRYELTQTTAKDVETGLTWERVASDQPYLREDAAGRCTKLQISGPQWRLPTIAELSSILDEEKADPPRLDPVAFPKGALDQGDWYWSSTGDAVNKATAAWTIRVLYGTVSELASPGPAYVRCVY